MIDEKEIKHIIYGSIRNPKHYKVRKEGYYKSIIKLTFSLLKYYFFSSKSLRKQKIILNFLSLKLINFQCAGFPKEFLTERVNIKNSAFRSVYFIELFLNICFVVEHISLQKLIIRKLEKYTHCYITKYEIQGLVCGPSTILTTFLSFILKEMGRETIIFQHGIYQLCSYKVEWYEKNVMSSVWVWGELYKKMYIEQGVPENKLKVFSPYFPIEFPENFKVGPIPKPKRVLFIGQQLNKISEGVFIPYNRVIENLRIFYSNLGLELIYKPHPREKIRNSLSTKNRKHIIIYEEEQMGGIEEFDIFYSLNSTLLIELYLKGKICFQVSVPIKDLKYDDFSKFTGIVTIKEDQIYSHLKIEEYSFYINKEYLNFWEDYQERVIMELKKQLSLH